MELLAHVRATIQQALIDGLSPDLNFGTSLIAAGSVAWDTCCGWLVVAPQRTFRWRPPFPQPVTADPCNAYIGMEVSAVWLRCVSEVDDLGNPPPVAQLQAEYDTLIADHDIIWNALLSNAMIEMGGWELERSDVAITYLGDQGGCVGLDARVSLGFDCETWG